jgi:hypothetical protein
MTPNKSTTDDVTVLRAARWLDITAESGDVRSPAVIVVRDNLIESVNPAEVPEGATEISLLATSRCCRDLMDMELNMLIGNRDETWDPMHGVKVDPALRTLMGVGYCKSDAAGGLHDGPQLWALWSRPAGTCSTWRSPRRSRRAGSRALASWRPGTPISPTGGHLDATMFQNLAPGIMPMSVEEGIANGVPEVRKCGALSDQARCAADQDLGDGRR